MDASYDRFVWRQESQGVWQRDIDEAETYYSVMAELYKGSGRMFFAITGHVALSVKVPDNQPQEAMERHVDESLRQAWLRLRSEQPAIASRVVYDDSDGTVRWKKVYQEARTEDAQRAWLASTFRPVRTAKPATEWCNADPPAPDLPTVFLLSQPNQAPGVIRREVVLRSPHDIMDGIGTLQLLNRLVALADAQHQGRATPSSQPAQPAVLDGSEVARLPPPYRVAANVPPQPTPVQKEHLRLIKESGDKAAHPGPRDGVPVRILTVPYKHGALLPGRHQRLARSLSQEQTRRLLAACKVLGVTVTHAFHAAIAMALRDVQQLGDRPLPVQYHSYILRNDRAYCAPPFDTAGYAAAVYHSVSGGRLVVDLTTRPFAVQADGLGTGVDIKEHDADFLRIVNGIKKYYRRVQQYPNFYALAPFILGASTPAVPARKDRQSPRPVPPPEETPSVSLSSLGLVDKIMSSRHGVFRLEEPWVVGEELGNGLGMFLGSFRGQLSLSIAYNDAWHDAASVADFLQRCEDIVIQSMGLRDLAEPPE